jgi:hypothetical protein
MIEIEANKAGACQNLTFFPQLSYCRGRGLVLAHAPCVPNVNVCLCDCAVMLQDIITQPGQRFHAVDAIELAVLVRQVFNIPVLT